MKRLNLKKFKELQPCKEGYEYVLNLKTTDLMAIFNSLKEHNLDWSNWLVVRLLSKNDRIRYAIFAAEQVIATFEKKYPKDKRPRDAINAVKAVLEKNTKKNRDAAYAASYAAYAASDAAAYAAANAADAAYAAANATSSAAYATSSAAYAAYCTANAAANASGKEMKLKIVEYGLTLLGVD